MATPYELIHQAPKVKTFEDIQNESDTQVENQIELEENFVKEESRKNNVDEEKLQTYLDKKPNKPKHKDTGSMNRAWNNIVDTFTFGDVQQAMRTDEYKDGRKWDNRNKDAGIYSDYTEKEMVEELKNIKDDPNASHVFYNLRYEIGTNEDGSKKYAYKNGIDKVGAYNRYKNQLGDGVEILSEKRFAGAEDFEGRINQIAFKRKYALVDNGDAKEAGLNFGSGYTELLSKDIFGLAETGKDRIADNLNKSKIVSSEAEKYRASHNSNNSLWEMAKGGDFTDALEYGVINTLAGLGDMAATGVSWVAESGLGIKNDLDKNNWFQKQLDNADKISGYDVKAFQQAVTESTNVAKKGSFSEAILGIGANIPALAEGIFSSAPEMALYAIGAGEVMAGSKIARGLLNAKSALAVAQKAGKTAEVAKLTKNIARLEAVAIESGSTGAYIAKLSSDSRMLNALAGGIKVSGFDVAVMSATNRVIDDRKANGDEDVTVGEFAAILGSQYLLLGMDKFAVTNILKDSGAIKKSLSEAYKVLPQQGKLGMISKLGKQATLIAKSTGTEAAQEYIQTWGEIFGKDLGVKGKGVSDVLSDEKNQDEALGASIAGGVAGGGMHAMGQVGGKASREAINAWKGYADVKSLRSTTASAAQVKNAESFSNKETPLDDKILSIALSMDSKEDHELDIDINEALDLVLGDENINDNHIATIAYGLSSKAKSSSSIEEFKSIVSAASKLNGKAKDFVVSDLLAGTINTVQEQITDITKSMGSIFDKGGNEIYSPTRKKGSARDIDGGVEKIPNPFYRKFDNQIKTLDEKISVKREAGFDVTEDVNYRNKLSEVNSNPNHVEVKTFAQTTEEISKTGLTIAGKRVDGYNSLGTYEISVPASINNGSKAELENINRFAGSRHQKFDDLREEYNGRPINMSTTPLAVQISSENQQMRKIITDAYVQINANEYLDKTIKDDMIAELDSAIESLDMADENYGNKIGNRAISKASVENSAPGSTTYVSDDTFAKILMVASDTQKIRDMLNEESKGDFLAYLSQEQSRLIQEKVNASYSQESRPNTGSKKKEEGYTEGDAETDAFVASMKTAQEENGAVDTINDQEMDRMLDLLKKTPAGKALDVMLYHIQSIALSKDQIVKLKSALDSIIESDAVPKKKERDTKELVDLNKRILALQRMIQNDSKDIDSKDIEDAFEFANEEMTKLSDKLSQMMNDEKDIEKASMVGDGDTDSLLTRIANKAVAIISKLATAIFKAKAEQAEISKFYKKLGKYTAMIKNKGKIDGRSKKSAIKALDQVMVLIQKKINADTKLKPMNTVKEPGKTTPSTKDNNESSSRNKSGGNKDTDESSESKSSSNNDDKTDTDSKTVKKIKALKGMPQSLSNEAYGIIGSMINNIDEGCK